MIHDLEEISDNNYKTFMFYINKISLGTPIQYIINKQEFMNLEFYVDENVLIPQPDTETLVEEALATLDNSNYYVNDEIKILDLCTGSGAIIISIAKNIYYPNAKLYASDISNSALVVAGENAKKHNVDIKFLTSDMFENISKALKFDLIVSNPPYIKTDIIRTLSKEVQNEPFIALDGGTDGLYFYKKIAKDANSYLNKNGHLILEIGYDQKDEVTEILRVNKFKNMRCKKDLAGNDRVIIAEKM